jgi:peptidyl-prolyl cis-trans isomerase SurA
MTKFNGGKLINMNSGSSTFELHELENAIKITVDELNVDEISSPAYVKMEDGKEAYRIFKLLSRTPTHQANFKDDYKLIRDMALEQKREQAITHWVENALLKTYVYIADSYQSSSFQYGW